MQIHLFQTDIRWQDPSRNIESLTSLVEELTPNSGCLLLIPEMFSTGFSMDANRIAEPLDGNSPASDCLARLARETGCCALGGVATRAADTRYNEALAAFPDGSDARYRKHQGFSLAGETEAYAGGDRLTTFDWGGGRVGMSICYDLRFPEIYRALAFGGAELLVNIANWPRRRIGHWTTLLQARAIENQCYVAAVNRVGEDPNSHYTGCSLVVDPHGEIIADAGETEGCVTAEIDFESVRAWRAEFPALRDARRSDLPVDHLTPSGH